MNSSFVSEFSLGYKPLPFERIPVASWVFFGLFLAFSIVELTFAYLEKEKQRKIVKPFCVLSLVPMVAIACPSAWLVYVGLLCGAIGDALLIYKHKVWTFVTGTFFFFLNHVFFILEYLLICSPLPWHWYITSFFLFVAMMLLSLPLLKKAIKTPKLVFGGTVYFATIILDLFWAISSCALGHFDFLFCNALGMISFLGSDIYLVKTLFVRDNKRRDFYIMSSYLLAQMLIAIGFTLTLLS